MARPLKEASKANANLVTERKFWLDNPQYSGMYLDDPSNIVLHKNTWPAFFAKIRSVGINYITLYNMSSLCVPANFPAIKDFIISAIAAGVKKVGGVWGSTSTVDKMVVYQNQSDYATQLSTFLEEYEVWNVGGWAARKPVRLDAYNKARGLTTPPIKYKANAAMYFGWFKDFDPGMSAAQAADTITTTTNMLMVHQYRSTPSWSNLLERLREIDNSLIRINFQGDYPIYPLISGESIKFKEKDGTACPNEFSGQYLKTKTPTDWYNEIIVKVKEYYNSSGDSGFKHIMISGIWTFDYWWLTQSRL